MNLKNWLFASGMALATSLSAAGYSDGCCPPPPCDPCASWCDNVSASLALLYWKVDSDDLSYASTKFAQDVNASNIQWKEHYHHIDPNWRAGFRLGVGFDMPSMGWDVAAIWTYYRISKNSHDHVNGPASPSGLAVNVPFIPNSGELLAAGDAGNLKGRFKFMYSVVDIDFGKWLCCGVWGLKFRPHAGLRFANINDTLSAEQTFTGVQLPFISQKGHIKQNFRGVGVEAGLDTDFRICDGWSLIGKFGGALVYGNTHNRWKASNTVSSGSFLQRGESKESYDNTRAFLNTALGLRWTTLVCDCYPLVIEALWESNFLYGQHSYFLPDNDQKTGADQYGIKRKGDLTLQGLTLNVAFDF